MRHYFTLCLCLLLVNISVAHQGASDDSKASAMATNTVADSAQTPDRVSEEAVSIEMGDNKLKAIYRIPAWVAETHRVCPWQLEGGEGYVRLVRTEVDGRHELYIQWIRKGIVGSDSAAISTLRVDELSTDYAVKMEVPAATDRSAPCELTALAEDILTERRYKLNLHIMAPGEYRLGVTHMMMGGL